MATIRCEFDPSEFSVARGAAEWVRAFYPDLTVILDGRVVDLASDERSDNALRLIWQTMLVNERLLVRGEADRTAVLKALVA